MSQTCSVKQRQSPAALGTLSIDMLLAHLVPDNVVVGELSPFSAHLSCCAEGCSVEVGEDLEAQFVGQGADEVDLNQVAYRR